MSCLSLTYQKTEVAEHITKSGDSVKSRVALRSAYLEQKLLERCTGKKAKDNFDKLLEAECALALEKQKIIIPGIHSLL